MWMHSKNYGFFSFIGDCIMFLLTCSLWIIWIIVREMRRINRPRSSQGYPSQRQQHREVIEYRYYE